MYNYTVASQPARANIIKSYVLLRSLSNRTRMPLGGASMAAKSRSRKKVPAHCHEARKLCWRGGIYSFMADKKPQMYYH